MYLFSRRDKLYANDPVGQWSNPRISLHICQNNMLFCELNESKNEAFYKSLIFKFRLRLYHVPGL